MKSKTLFLLFAISFVLAGCSLFECSIHDDFEQYKKLTMGNCDFETDGKRFILPSEDFIDRFEFENARYYHFARPFLETSDEYTFSYLHFEYSKEIYLEAKGFMLSEAKPFNDHYEYYNDFVFYENTKAVEADSYPDEPLSQFPYWFWMLGYNDDSNSLLFCGFHRFRTETNENRTWDEILEITILLTLDI